MLFDKNGVVYDAVYYNQLSACRGAVRHSGDNKDGSLDGVDEEIT